MARPTVLFTAEDSSIGKFEKCKRKLPSYENISFLLDITSRRLRRNIFSVSNIFAYT